MAINKSVFDPTNNDDVPIRGGLDRFLGPPARSYSHMPADLIDGIVEDETDPGVEDPESGQVTPAHADADPERGAGTNPDEPVQQIKAALDEKLATEPPRAPDADPFAKP